MAIWTLAKKDFRLVFRDTRALVILLAMPLIFVLVLGVSVGEGFGRKAADRLRVTVLNLDRGLPRFFDRPAMVREGFSWLSVGPMRGDLQVQVSGALAVAEMNRGLYFPHDSWADEVLRDLGQTAGIAVELLESREEADRLIESGRRPAVLILGPDFSKRVTRSSFLAAGWKESLTFTSAFPRPGLPFNLALAGLFNEGQDAVPLYFLDGINPFHRDGVKLSELDVQVRRDPTQQMAAAIIDQVVQTTMLRVVLPWMIGRAFERIADPAFIDLLSRENVQVRALGFQVPLSKILVAMNAREKQALGASLQNALQRLYPKYNLTAKTWESLTRSSPGDGIGVEATRFQEEGVGWLKRGAMRYQLLVPSYTVMFAFFLVLTVGWLFVAERRQGTLKRLRAAPLTRGEILVGKLLPCYALSLFQGFFLLAAGRAIFGMSWGEQPAWLVPIVLATSLAAMGLAMLLAALARTETQVSIYGTLLVLVLAGFSGAMMADPPEHLREISHFTPHAWALDAYRQLLANPGPVNVTIVGQACLVLAAFGVGFLALAWWSMKLE